MDNYVDIYFVILCKHCLLNAHSHKIIYKFQHIIVLPDTTYANSQRHRDMLTIFKAAQLKNPYIIRTVNLNIIYNSK